MQRIPFTSVLAAAVLAASVIWPESSSAQSNPLLPAGVGSGRDVSNYYYHSGGSADGKERLQARGDKNPAETLLREMNGTSYRRHSGRAYFRGRPVEEAQRMLARQRDRDRRRAQLEQTILAKRATRQHRASDRSTSANRPRRLPPPRGPVY